MVIGRRAIDRAILEVQAEAVRLRPDKDTLDAIDRCLDQARQHRTCGCQAAGVLIDNARRLVRGERVPS